MNRTILLNYLSDVPGVSDIVNYLIIQLFDISSMSDILKHLFIYLSDVFGVSDIVNYLIIQQFDISSMSDVLIHSLIYLSDISGVSDIVNYVIIQLSDISSLSDIVNYANIHIFDISHMSDILKHSIIYLSDVFGVSDIVNYSIIQLSDISHMSNVLNHLNIVCPLNIQSGLAWPVQTAHWIFIEYWIRIWREMSRLISMLLYTTDTVIHAYNLPVHLIQWYHNWIFSVGLGGHVLDMDGILISWHVTIVYIV